MAMIYIYLGRLYRDNNGFIVCPTSIYPDTYGEDMLSAINVNTGIEFRERLELAERWWYNVHPDSYKVWEDL